jgi:DNA-directed RNA polymerase specialized sigma24 family protein
MAADREPEVIRAVIERATTGDAAAAAWLVALIAPVIRGRIARGLARRRRGRVGAELDDFVQDTLARLFEDGGRALRAWDPARGLGLFGFVGLLADREVGMAMRTRTRNPWTEEPTAAEALARLHAPAAAPNARFEARDLLRRVVAGVRGRLSPAGRGYFQLLVVEDQPVRAVAAQTGLTTDTLYTWRARLTRLMHDVHRELEPDQRAETA